VRGAENRTDLPPAPFTALVVPGKLLDSRTEIWIKLYLGGFSNILVKYGTGMRKDGGDQAERKKIQSP